MAKTSDNAALEQAQKVIQDQDAYLKQITEGAAIYGTVIDRDGDKLVVANASKTTRVNVFANAQIGTPVVLQPETSQIIGLTKRRNIGVVALLADDLGNNRWSVETEGGVKKVAVAADKLNIKPEGGDLVLLDVSGAVFTEVLPRKETEFAATDANVRWDDIGGNDKAKLELREAIDFIRGGNATFARYNASAPKGILFSGPPGCGKTMLGKAAATELAGDGAGAFLYIKAPELLSMYVGQTEARIRGVFAQARNYYKAHGQTPLLFIDEADALLQKRGSGISSDVEKTIVPTFLTEMDGLANSSALVILATNRRDTLDEAVVRDGRIDRRITVERPNWDVTKTIFELNLANLPIRKGQSGDQIAEAGTETIFQPGPVAEQVSGALIAGVVSRAKSRAIRRDLKDGGVSGIGLDDVTASILEIGMEAA